MEKLTRRQRRDLERQQRKQQNKKVRELGLSRNEAKLLERPAVSKEQKKQLRNIEKKYNYRHLRSIGYTTQEAKRFQGASKETIQSLSKTIATPLTDKKLKEIEEAGKRAKAREEAERAQRELNKMLVIYWRDLIEFADQETVTQQRSLFRHMRIDNLEGSAKNLAQLTFGESPASLVGIRMTKDLEKTRRYLKDRDFLFVYEGKGTDYRHLLIAVNTMMLLLYDPGQKSDFMMELINNLRSMPTQKARNNAARLYRLGI